METLGKPDLLPICETDFVDGAEFFISEYGQEYPVTFLSWSGVIHWCHVDCNFNLVCISI